MPPFVFGGGFCFLLAVFCHTKNGDEEMTIYDRYKEEQLKNPQVRAEYERLRMEFETEVALKESWRKKNSSHKDLNTAGKDCIS